MRISANDVVALLKKVDEVEDKAGIAFTTCDQQDLQIALEKARELRPMLYGVLASGAEDGTPYPVLYPVYPYKDTSWGDFPKVTCSSGTSGNG